MSFVITTLSPKQFKNYTKNGVAHVVYYQTPAGIIKVESCEQKIVRAQFVHEPLPDGAEIITSADKKELLLVGTEFQLQVWQLLLTIPAGTIISYQDIARALGQAKACRAVARAVASNKIAYFVPCHRVLKKDRSLCGYNWGVERKRALLASEGLPY